MSPQPEEALRRPTYKTRSKMTCYKNLVMVISQLEGQFPFQLQSTETLGPSHGINVKMRDQHGVAIHALGKYVRYFYRQCEKAILHVRRKKCPLRTECQVHSSAGEATLFKFFN